MGTNYYAHRNCCPHCGRGDEPLHIGKSSSGWCFSLHVYTNDGPFTLEDWKQFLSREGVTIKDEYDREVTLVDMLDNIERRKWDRLPESTPSGYSSWEEFHERNHSCNGPNGLLRHRVDGRYCIAHGSGTFDLIIGDFS